MTVMAFKQCLLRCTCLIVEPHAGVDRGSLVAEPARAVTAVVWKATFVSRPRFFASWCHGLAYAGVGQWSFDTANARSMMTEWKACRDPYVDFMPH